MKAPTRPSAGFSRLELLAVIACTGVLAALALPLRAGGAAHSRASLCFDNFRRLAVALELYTLENGWYPPNPDDGSTTPGRNWIAGQAAIGSPHAFNPDLVENPNQSLLARYLGTVGQVFACPEDQRWGTYQGTRADRRGETVPVTRSISMSGSVGIDPNLTTFPTPVGGPWLDNQHGHTYGKQWRTYGRPEHAVDPTPAGLAILIDEDAYSINDGSFAFGMAHEEWIDWPATRHESAATISFADGHVEIHRWLDPRTVVINGAVGRLRVPESVDVRWLQKRTSALLPR